MNKIFFWLIIGMIIFQISACTKKTEPVTSGDNATVQVINGVVLSSVMLKTNGRINNSLVDNNSSGWNTVDFGAARMFFTQGKTQSIEILRYPDSVSLLSKSLDLKKGGIYTLLIGGINPNIDAVLVDDTNLPYVNLSSIPNSTDSVINVRFVNLAPDVPNVDVRIQGASSNEVTALAFKGASSWKSYPAKSNNGNYVFEYVQNGIVLKTLNLSITTTNRFKNVALMLRGMKTPGTGQPGLFLRALNYFQ